MNVIMLQHLIIQFSLYYLSSGRLRKVKHKRKFQLLAVKVVAIAYKRWSLTRGSKFNNLTWKLLIFWKTGRWGDLGAVSRIQGVSGVYTSRFLDTGDLKMALQAQKLSRAFEKRAPGRLWKVIANGGLTVPTFQPQRQMNISFKIRSLEESRGKITVFS